MATSGALSVWASATPSSRLMAPGPRVARQTPALPVTRPYRSAMKAAPSSDRTRIKRMVDRFNASTRGMISSPGSPKIKATPSFSRQRATSSETFISAKIAYIT